MKTLLSLSLRSLWNRRVTVALTMLTLAVSVTLLLGVERVRHQAQASFTQTISGTDLIVGARSGPVQLLLYSVFHIGNATNDVSWESYQDVASSDLVAWTVPIALGDSHRGYRVMGTTRDFFEQYKYAKTQSIRFADGKAFDGVFDAVIGAEVAKALGYDKGREIVLSHGTGSKSFMDHGDKPFTVTGVLEPTGTPVDRTVLVSLKGIEAIHVGWERGAPPPPGQQVSADKVREMDLTPSTVTAFLVGLESRVATFKLQRAINNYDEEPLTAILPGVALTELWQVIGVVEDVLLAISAMVVLAGLTGMIAALLTSLNERRREMAILRSVGARPYHIFGLFLLEGTCIGTLACVIGLVTVQAVLWLGQGLIQQTLGIYLSVSMPGVTEWLILGAVILASALASSIPAWRAYRLSLADGLTVRV